MYIYIYSFYLFIYIYLQVGRLATSLGVVGDVDYSCETAQHFFLFNVLSRWEEYEHKVSRRAKRQCFEDCYPDDKASIWS